MKNTTGFAIVGIAIVGIGAAVMSGVFNPQFADGGVDVRATRCEDIGSARVAISNEREERKLAAQNSHAEKMDVISDAYWEQNQKLEAEISPRTRDSMKRSLMNASKRRKSITIVWSRHESRSFIQIKKLRVKQRSQQERKPTSLTVRGKKQ